MAQAASQYPEQLALEEESGGILSRNGKALIAAVVLIGALSYFGFMAYQSTVYYYTVSEMNALGPTPEGQIVRVNGKLVPTSFQRPDGSTLAHFTLTDGSESLDAVYSGVVPDLFFNEHSEIILEGTYGADGVFNSQNVIVKCPSKYIAADGAEKASPQEYVTGG